MLTGRKCLQALVIFFQVFKHMTCYPILKVYRRYPKMPYLVSACLCYYIYTRLKTTLPPELSSDQKIIFHPNRDSIKLVSYSVGCGSHVLLGTMGSCRQKFSSLISGVSDYDIILLQGVYVLHIGPLHMFGNVHFLNSQMYEQGFKYRATYKRSMKYKFLSHNNGVASFSRLPIVTSNSIVFECASLEEYPAGRGYDSMLVSISTPNTSRTDVGIFSEDANDKLSFLIHSLYIFNVHLDSFVERTRTCQLQELFTRISNLPPDSFVVICGNLNIDASKEGSVETFQLRKMMEDANLVEVYNTRDPTHHDGAHYDYMITSKNIEVLSREIRGLRTDSGDHVSDHFGLFTEIQLIIPERGKG